MPLATFSHKGQAMAQVASRWPLPRKSCFDHEPDHVIFVSLPTLTPSLLAIRRRCTIASYKLMWWRVGMWYSWCTKWHWNRILTDLFPSCSQYHSIMIRSHLQLLLVTTKMNIVWEHWDKGMLLRKLGVFEKKSTFIFRGIRKIVKSDY